MDLKEEVKVEATMRLIGAQNVRKRNAQAKAHKRETQYGATLQLMKILVPDLAEALVKATKKRRVGSAGRVLVALPYLRKVKPEVAALICCRTIFDGFSSEKKLTAIAVQIGSRIEDEVKFSQFKKQDPRGFRDLIRKVKHSNDYRFKHRVMTYGMRRNEVITRWEPWTTPVKIKIGAFLIDLLARTKSKPIELLQVRDQWLVVPSADTMRGLALHDEELQQLSPWFLPMVDKPRRWTTPWDGGYLSYPLELVKDRHPEYLKMLAKRDLTQVYQALNRVQETPWRVNEDVLVVLEELWHKDFELPGVPLRDYVSVRPVRPPGLPEIGEKLNAEQKRNLKAYKREVANAIRLEVANKSRLSAAIQTLMVARMFRTAETLYYPHTLDWRGRMYPSPTFLSPQGDDLSRGLIRFAEGKVLDTPAAWRWWHIHGANTFGEDKVPFADRIGWVADNHARIMACASDPVSHLWWMEADSPWQFLAWCLEYFRSQNFRAEGLPFFSYLPVSMDGSCNGLQHLSAMLRDSVGGAAVNLLPNAQPQDIYQVVADVVRKRVEQDKKDNKWARQWLASGLLNRSVVKRQVMTKPYGASRHGMFYQLLDHLHKEKGTTNDFPLEDLWSATNYLSPIIFESIDEVVVAARDVMQWLQVCAAIVAKQEMPIKWTTPVGLVVVQAYRWNKRELVDTKILGRIQLRWRRERPKIDKRKSQWGLSPNFVHSIDAAHMMMTINAMPQDTCFAMVHDSYGCHAADAEQMAKALREQFVKLYSEHDVLAEFKREIELYVPKTLPTPPTRGNLEIEQVLGAKYFFA